MTLPKSKYKNKDNIYIYTPQHSLSDANGVMTYKIIGMTKKNSDKRILVMCEDLHPKAIFKHVYFEITDNGSVDCGHIYPNTEKNFNGAKVGESYKGYRNSKWIKLDPRDYDFGGKVYYEIKTIK